MAQEAPSSVSSVYGPRTGRMTGCSPVESKDCLSSFVCWNTTFDSSSETMYRHSKFSIRFTIRSLYSHCWLTQTMSLNSTVVLSNLQLKKKFCSFMSSDNLFLFFFFFFFFFTKLVKKVCITKPNSQQLFGVVQPTFNFINTINRFTSATAS